MKLEKRHFEKYIGTAFDYLPARYIATKEQWNIRKFIWRFKDGDDWAVKESAKLVTNALKKHYDKLDEYVFACIPASTNEKTQRRYKQFSEIVCHSTGMDNAFCHISVTKDCLAIHESKKNIKSIHTVSVINFDQSYFRGKKIIVFDDIITKGTSLSRFTTCLENMNADVIGAYFLAKTINP